MGYVLCDIAMFTCGCDGAIRWHHYDNINTHTTVSDVSLVCMFVGLQTQCL